ncbi:uncharacterized protein EV420DRAFT_1482091 [Desarmillaria tabescens]|uniref:Uncharacterized protein n=1 Tax=Armillaria tabescens TaxID=1929756 RepID=A0AA39MZV3_ARMTA|nr:uncharacterized protein EV420DRAFT_1482091 [Desarmillaria tabescens]KAK0452792.1 hypothetical protein EV420DRAFT_1482091 [Desarmillaria tabescens]
MYFFPQRGLLGNSVFRRHDGCNWDNIKKLVCPMQLDLLQSNKAMIKHLQMKSSQLAQFDDIGKLGNSLTVDSLSSTHTHYLLWANSQEEAVLNIQGVLAEVYIPPITTAEMKSLTKAYQSMKIVALEDDKQFASALHAIDNIENFMMRHSSPMDHPMAPTFIGDLSAIHAENRLLVPRHFCSDAAIDPSQEVDANGVLRATIRKGMHMYMDDNVVLFQEWTKDNGNKT